MPSFYSVVIIFKIGDSVTRYIILFLSDICFVWPNIERRAIILPGHTAASTVWISENKSKNWRNSVVWNVKYLNFYFVQVPISMQLRRQLQTRIIQCFCFNKNRNMSWFSSGSSNDELIDNLKGKKKCFFVKTNSKQMLTNMIIFFNFESHQCISIIY